MSQTDRVREIIFRLKHKYPKINTALNYSNAFELLIATILSAQCTDKRVNIVTKTLFAKYPTAQALANANLDDVKKIVRPTGFYNNKAKNIISASKKMVEDYYAKVPNSIDKLITLPGVARKTASVVMHVCYNQKDALAVDTHVKRVSNRLGLTSEDDPVKIEQDLRDIVDSKELGDFGLRLIQHGRDTCVARKPRCDECFLRDICPVGSDW